MNLLSAALALLSVVAANPIQRAAEDQKLFHLKTTDATQEEHNNLYLYGYHTSAGMNDAVLTEDVKTASPAFMNGTSVQFSLDTPFPWGLIMISNDYGAWDEVMINAGYGENDFSVNATGLQWSEAIGFGGWLACDWNHNSPQLFYMNRFRKHDLPEECSEVNLQLEYI
jgi:hypothetical protein